MAEDLHASNCECRFCRASSQRLLRPAEWIARHRDHQHQHGREFRREVFPHPSGTWFWLVCPCGAKLLTAEGSENW
jgi:hypothetical protein